MSRYKEDATILHEGWVLSAETGTRKDRAGAESAKERRIFWSNGAEGLDF